MQSLVLSLCLLLELAQPRPFRRRLGNGLVNPPLEEMARRLHATSARVVDHAFLDLYEQLLKYLYSLSVEVELDDHPVRLVRQCPPHQEIAAQLGTSREVVTRTLKQLEHDGNILRDEKQIILRIQK